MSIFQRSEIKQILVDSLSHLHKSGKIKLYAFVVMPNHIHWISRFACDPGLSGSVRDFKKFTARQIVQKYQFEINSQALSMLEKEARSIRDQQYKVWEDGFDARDIFSTNFLRQKVDYIHQNPCQSRWRLVTSPEEYPWSSAAFYLANRPAIIDLDDVRDLMVG